MFNKAKTGGNYIIRDLMNCEWKESKKTDSMKLLNLDFLKYSQECGLCLKQLVLYY